MYSYSTDDGVNREESGSTFQSAEGDINEIRGSYSWTSPEGETFTLSYVANEHGFQPQGAHVPRNNAQLPIAIQKGLELQERLRQRDAQRQG